MGLRDPDGTCNRGADEDGQTKPPDDGFFMNSPHIVWKSEHLQGWSGKQLLVGCLPWLAACLGN